MACSCRELSILLSTYLDRRVIGTQRNINNRRKVMAIEETIHNKGQNISTFLCGDASDGTNVPGLDSDILIVYNDVMVLSPEHNVPPTDKTTLTINEDDSRPGYVALQLTQTGKMCSTVLQNSFVHVGNAVFVSSDIFQEQTTIHHSDMGLPGKSNVPRSTQIKTDYLHSFQCNSWPKRAKEWERRIRLSGWPSQTLIDRIVQKGCHLVPIRERFFMDKTSQWKISFASAERFLIHSFSNVQLKVYCLMKYFFEEIRDTLTKITGEDSILPSDSLKTVMFFALENAHQNVWQEQNLFYCFWFCFNILLSFVKTGHLPNYFIPANNMFLGKVNHQNRKKLFHILNYFHKNKLLCLSFGKFFQPPLLERICNSKTQKELKCSQHVSEVEYQDDASIFFGSVSVSNQCTSMRPAMSLLMKSQSEVEEAIAYGYTLRNISLFAQHDYCHHIAGSSHNKTRYKRTRKCRHQIILCAAMGTCTELLYLATFYFLTGNYSKSLEICRNVLSQPSYYTEGTTDLPPKQRISYLQEYCGKGYTLIYKLKKTLTKSIGFGKESLFLPCLQPEVVKCPSGLYIPPLPYTIFLSFLCCKELGDIKGYEAALHSLIVVKYDDLQGAHRHWIVHTLLGLCYETLDDHTRAVRAYMESAQTKTRYHDFNPAPERIEALQRLDTG